MTTQSPFLSQLPFELRLKVYAYLFEPTGCLSLRRNGEKTYDFTQVLSLLLVNRQIYAEARKVFREENLFIRIQSPWPQMKDHVRDKQKVPIVCADDRARRFRGCSLIMSLDAPAYVPLDNFDEHFVLHHIDLPSFTEQWALADMSYNLNENLRMSFELDAPYTPSYEVKQLPKQIQRRLLLPFTNVKRLSDFSFTGQLQPYSAVEKELRDGQNTPYKKPEACLRDASKKYQEGNVELSAGKYKEALGTFRQAWAEMHIIVDGRDRQIHADAHYAKLLSEEPYSGKNGAAERMTLRVGLVANTCQALLGLKEFADCQFWGERSINAVREAIGVDEDAQLTPEQEAMPGMPAGRDMGRIYLYTAIANAALGISRRAKAQFLVAKEYMPSESEVILDWVQKCDNWISTRAQYIPLDEFEIPSAWP